MPPALTLTSFGKGLKDITGNTDIFETENN